MNVPAVSIIICTRNRVDSLRQTLASIGQVLVPTGMEAELLVVDNGSSDQTQDVVANAALPNMPVRYIHEPRKGKSYAYNTGMAGANGEVFLFTDDDVRVPPDWIEGMCAPILSGAADAVAGGVCLPPHLVRPWMTLLHRYWLAETGWLDPDEPSEMVGANMAFHRRVLGHVPLFDVELGPGALGFGEESLFGFQLRDAGFRIGAALETCVEHHFDVARLARAYWLADARKRGRTWAYLSYHWFHSAVPSWPACLRACARYAKWWVCHPEWQLWKEGADEDQLKLLQDAACAMQFRREARSSRRYLRARRANPSDQDTGVGEDAVTETNMGGPQ